MYYQHHVLSSPGLDIVEEYNNWYCNVAKGQEVERIQLFIFDSVMLLH